MATFLVEVPGILVNTLIFFRKDMNKESVKMRDRQPAITCMMKTAAPEGTPMRRTSD